MLIVVALVVLAMTIAVVRKYRARGGPDLGWVTERWLAEYRADASRPSRYPVQS